MAERRIKSVGVHQETLNALVLECAQLTMGIMHSSLGRTARSLKIAIELDVPSTTSVAVTGYDINHVPFAAGFAS